MAGLVHLKAREGRSDFVGLTRAVSTVESGLIPTTLTSDLPPGYFLAGTFPLASPVAGSTTTYIPFL